VASRGSYTTIRTGLALGLTAACGLVGAAHAGEPPTQPRTVKPGRHPAQVDARRLPIRGGDPSPEGLGHAPVPDRCLGRARRGTVSLRRYVDRWFRGHSLGIYNCRNVAGTSHLSTHAEGRALDWALNAAVSKERREARRIIRYFLSADSAGKPRAMARRWGIELIIYNERFWSVNHDREGWRSCRDLCSGHTDHLHIQQNWRGAKRKLSAWTGWTYTAPAR
jgi:hypothetical protein